MVKNILIRNGNETPIVQYSNYVERSESAENAIKIVIEICDVSLINRYIQNAWRNWGTY